MYILPRPQLPPRREVLFKLNGAKLSEPGGPSKWRRGAARRYANYYRGAII